MICSKKGPLVRGIAAIAVVAAACFIAGTSYASTGGLQISKAVTQDFNKDQLNHKYHYYALMDDGGPYALVGLEKGYRMTGPGWTPIKLDSPKFKTVTSELENSPVEGSSTYGAYIQDSQGRDIGVWFSSMMAGETVNSRAKTVSVKLHPNLLLN